MIVMAEDHLDWFVGEITCLGIEPAISRDEWRTRLALAIESLHMPGASVAFTPCSRVALLPHVVREGPLIRRTGWLEARIILAVTR